MELARASPSFASGISPGGLEPDHLARTLRYLQKAVEIKYLPLVAITLYHLTIRIGSTVELAGAMVGRNTSVRGTVPYSVVGTMTSTFGS